VLNQLVRLAQRLKDTWEWWGILAAFGLPGVPAVLGLFEGQPWSVLALYGVGAVAYWVVLVAEGRPILDDWRARRSAIPQLIALRAGGVGLLNAEYPTSNEEVKAYGDAIDAWEADVLEALRIARAPASERAWFETLGTFPQRFMTGNPMYLTHRDILAEKLERLTVIMRRLEGGGREDR
jgi:hypothetical protein